LQAPDQILETVRKLCLERVFGKRIAPSVNPASDRARGSSSAQTWKQEFVIGGYVPGARGFDAMLVGVCEKRELIFVAKVKNGFVPRIRDELFPALKALQTAQCPFTNLPEKKASRWANR
jgi:hypothetical protein